LIIGLALAALLALSGTAAANVTFDPNTFTGSVGKGDVQAALRWNNPTLQARAGAIRFGALDRQEADVFWECRNTVTGDFFDGHYHTTWIARFQLADAPRTNKHQITGFALNGSVGDPNVLSFTVDPPNGLDLVDTCPAGPWELVQGAHAEVSDTFTPQVSGDGGATWTRLGR
jgi:hypothetical protein